MSSTTVCGKMQALDRLLEKFVGRHKVLVFSFSVQTLNVLEAFAKSKGGVALYR